MKNYVSKKNMSIVLLIIITTIYTHCTRSGKTNGKSALEFQETDLKNSRDIRDANNTSPSPSTRDAVSSTQTSIDAFGETVHLITKIRCNTCHGSFQQPLHAVPDILIAHNAVIDNNKVKFSNTAQSRLVLKLKDSSHNCWSDCNSNAAEMLVAINEWKARRDSAVDININDPIVNEDLGVITEESLSIEEELNNSSGAMDGEILILAESGNLKSPMIKARDAEIESIWVSSTGILTDFADVNAGAAYYIFDSTISDNYKIYGLVNAPSGSDNSFWIKVNNGSYIEWHINQTEGFEWREVTHTSAQNSVSTFIPSAFSQSFQVVQREDGTKLSKIIISNKADINFQEVTGKAKTTLKFSLNNIIPNSQAMFEITVEEFDNYSYKFSNPKMTSSIPLVVKNIKLLINGEFNVQHSTYTLVDLSIPSGTTILSPRSLIALKEMGIDKDKVSFSFEILQAQ